MARPLIPAATALAMHTPHILHITLLNAWQARASQQAQAALLLQQAA